MFNRFFLALCLSLSAVPALPQQTELPDAAQAPAPVQAGAGPAQERILVIGQRPGPGLWKIAMGDHVLWLLGTCSPLPKKMEWRSHQVEAIIARSQEYLPPPSAEANVGFFGGLTLLPQLIGFKNNPNGARLRDVLPEEVYTRWLLLKTKYIGNDESIESERPMFAVEELYSKALAQAGLSSGNQVLTAVEKIARKNGIKKTSTMITLDINNPSRAMKEFKKMPIDDVACFSNTLEHLENDIDTTRIRANAWAKGDLEAIKKLSYVDHDKLCSATTTDSSAFKEEPELQSITKRMHNAWMAAAEKALATNTSTFAVLSMKDILDPQGPVAALRHKGYAVDAPD